MSEPIERKPCKRTIQPDLKQEVEDIQIKIPRTKGPPDDLDDQKKRWLIVGICLHSIITPVLRTCVERFIDVDESFDAYILTLQSLLGVYIKRINSTITALEIMEYVVSYIDVTKNITNAYGRLLTTSIRFVNSDLM